MRIVLIQYEAPVTPNGDMPHRLYSVLNKCQRVVGSPRNTPKISNLP